MARWLFVLALIAISAVGASPAPSATSAVELTRIYRGDDGGALYTRLVGSTLVGFGEHPGRGYAYVFTGTVVGNDVSGKWYGVPKGAEKSSGDLRLRWSQDGARIVRTAGDDFGPDVFSAIAPTGIPWPGERAAGFQTTSHNYYDGVFSGDDGSRHYVRETQDGVFWVGEAGAQPGVRPAWVSVFVGKRTPTGFTGTWADVPKGIAGESGTFGAALVGGRARGLRLVQTGAAGLVLTGTAARTHSLVPDYAFDFDVFAKTIRDALTKNGVVGYAYALARNGAVLQSGADGDRINATDGGPRDFTTTTQAQAGSTSKTLTALALVKALDAKGISLDARIGKYLPSCWKRGPLVEGHTFRQLLNHTSSLPRSVSSPSDKTGRKDPYELLRRAVEIGQDGFVVTWTYNNNAYALMRLLVPAVLDLTGTQATFDSFECKNTDGALNAKISEKFKQYLFESVISPSGATASFSPFLDRVAYAYDKRFPAAIGVAPNKDFFSRAGAGYLSISALDMVRILGAFDRGEIVSPVLVTEMKSKDLGFDPPRTGATGVYVTKNGTCPGTGSGPGCDAQLMLYPGGYEAYVIVNSDSGGSLANLLVRAFDGALSG